MRDCKRIKTCPECGTDLQFGSGCYFCPECGHGKCGKHEAIRTGASFILMLFLLSLMGWSCLDYPVQEKTPTLIDKQQLKLYTNQAMAEYTAALNAKMELQALQVTK